ncbi:phosphoglycolate phosphatase [Amaricoccus macauensis]|uniref:phosphoglycolate phosphatase n=1 Tax=Amaricoccus macauensis TaxID=57001 RepID=A0A840STA0_9RHOB|nr:phosphoglycolate phosphatase [Amaricoccus macauensis]
MPQLSAFVFDLDGTLIDSAPDIAAALNVGFARHGWPEVGADEVGRFMGGGPMRLILDLLAERGIAGSAEEVARAHALYREAYAASPAERTRIYPNVREDLAALRRSGARLGVCTNKLQSLADLVIRSLGLDSSIEIAVGADAVPACKPDPGHLLAVAERMGLAEGTWGYVGDTDIDRATAEAAGVPFFLVPWGASAEVNVAPERRLTRLGDLLAYRGVEAG